METFLSTQILGYGGFVVFVLAMLALDLGVFNRTPHKVSVKESLVWTGVWVALAMIFNAGVWYFMGGTAAEEFFAGYVLEKALSVENIMIFVLVFQLFKIPAELQHRVLFFGILGALVFRSIFIAAGAAIISQFQWVLYLFGLFLLFTAVKMLWLTQKKDDGGGIVRWIARIIPMSHDPSSTHFVTHENGKRLFTPLFGALLAIEISDVIFALDSVPAIFAITDKPFIVFTSNIFAILGLRSLYFASAHMIEKFHYLKVGVGIVLLWIAAKLLLHGVVKIPIELTLGIIALVITSSILISIFKPNSDTATNGS
jgi:tellurite resistance protein TerC